LQQTARESVLPSHVLTGDGFSFIELSGTRAFTGLLKADIGRWLMRGSIG
jgi:hypothetical protein